LRFPQFEGEWGKSKLEDVTEKINSGKTPLGGESNYLTEGILFIRSQNVNNERLELDNSVFISEGVNASMKNSVVKPNDILLNITGASLGRSCVVPENFKVANVNQHVCIIRVKKGYNPRFIQPILSSQRGQAIFESLQTGSGREGLNFESIKKIALHFPSLSEQGKIANFLSLIDCRIQTQNKIIEDFRSLKQIMIKKLFSRQLKFKDSEGKYFPNWEETKLRDLTTMVSNRNKNNEKLPVYSINNKLGFVPQNEQFDGINSDERGYDMKMYKIIGKNTFAYNPARINVGSLGYSGELENIIISSLYVCFKTNESVSDQFLLQYLKTDFFNKEVTKNVEGGVRDYLFYDNFARIKINMPCIKEQIKIANLLAELDQKISIEAIILQNLEDQKKYFLQKLFI